MPKTGKAAPRSDVKILSPQPVIWEIGNKTFEQKPLRIDRLGDVLEEILNVMLGSGRGAMLSQVIESVGQEGAGDRLGQLAVPILARTLVAIPKRLPKIVSLIIPDAKEPYLRDHLNVRQALKIVQTFVEQNEIGALVQDFFDLLASVRQSVELAAVDLQDEAAMTTGVPLAAETEQEAPSEQQ